MKNVLHKIGVATLTLTMMLSALTFAVRPTPAYALDLTGLGAAAAQCAGVGDLIAKGLGALQGLVSGFLGIGGLLGGSVPVSDSGTHSETGKANAKENCMDAVAYQLKLTLLQNVSDGAKSWIQGSDGQFQGTAGFVQNLDQRLRDAMQVGFNQFVANSPALNDICNNWKGDTFTQLKKDFVGQYGAGSSISWQGLAVDPNKVCGLDQVTGSAEDSEAFAKGDITKGGWAAWREFVINGNNPIDSYLKAKTELQNEVTDSSKKEQEKLSWAGGFLPQVQCPAGSSQQSTGLCKDGAGNVYPPAIITPPGSVERITNDIIQSDVDRIDLADEVNEVIGQIGNLFVNKVLTKGLADAPAPITTGGISIDCPDGGVPDAAGFCPVDGGNEEEQQENQEKEDALKAQQECVDKATDIANLVGAQEQAYVTWRKEWGLKRVADSDYDDDHIELFQRIAQTEAQVVGYMSPLVGDATARAFATKWTTEIGDAVDAWARGGGDRSGAFGPTRAEIYYMLISIQNCYPTPPPPEQCINSADFVSSSIVTQLSDFAKYRRAWEQLELPKSSLDGETAATKKYISKAFSVAGITSSSYGSQWVDQVLAVGGTSSPGDEVVHPVILSLMHCAVTPTTPTGGSGDGTETTGGTGTGGTGGGSGTGGTGSGTGGIGNSGGGTGVTGGSGGSAGKGGSDGDGPVETL